MLRLLRIVGLLGGACVVTLVLCMGVVRHDESQAAWILYISDQCPGDFKQAMMLPDGRFRRCREVDGLRRQSSASSPDGQWAVNSWTGDVDEDLVLFNMSTDGSNRRWLTQAEGDEYDPAWSPDGQWIAYALEQIRYHIRADGTQQQLTNIASDIHRIPPHSTEWQQLADSASDIYRIRPDGTDRQQLTNSSSVVSSPTWSPDSQWLAFVMDGDIYRMRSDGSNLQQLTTDAAEDYSPSWSPDGRWLVFISEVNWNQQTVYRMRPDGTDLQPWTALLNDLGISHAAGFQWSPDGEWVVFAATRTYGSSGVGDVYRLKTDGSVMQQLTHSSPNSQFGGIRPFWSNVIDLPWRPWLLGGGGVLLMLVAGWRRGRMTIHH